MVSRPLNVDPQFLQFADAVAQQVSGGEGRLNLEDPDAVRKLFTHVDAQATELEAQTGEPKENLFRNFFDQTIGRAAGAAGRGALGAGRAIEENVLEPGTRPFRQQGQSAAEDLSILVNPDDPRIRPGARDDVQRVADLLDASEALAQTGGSLGTETIVAPVVGPVIPGDDAFERFVSDVQRRRQEASLREQILLQPSRDAFNESDIPTPVKVGAEVVFDPLNVVPGAALASRTGRVVRTAAREAAESAARNTARTVTEVLPDGTQVRRAIDEVSPVGQAEALDIVDEFRPSASGGFDRVSTTQVDDVDTFMQNIPETDRIASRIDELSLQIEQESGSLIRPSWARGLTNQEVRAVARHEGLNPTEPDWFAGIDPLIVQQARQRVFRDVNTPSISQLRGELRNLQTQLANLSDSRQTFRAAAETVQQTGDSTPRIAREVEQAQETIARTAPDTPASSIDNELAQLEQEIAAARVQQAAGGNPPPRKPGTAIMGGDDIPPPRQPHVAMGDDFQIPVHESVQTGVFRKWSGARNLERLQINESFKQGEDLLRQAGIRNANTRTPEMENLFKALHGEFDWRQLPEEFQIVYLDLKRLIDAETQDMLRFLEKGRQDNVQMFGLDAENFVARMAAHPDYFPRGWKQRPQQGASSVGTRPGFTRPRTDATFTELLDSGLEPASWNPFAMMSMRRLAGVEYREQVKAIHILKQHGLVKSIDEAPEGWRVPKIGPAFEGRPVAIADNGNTIFSQRFATPNRIADEMETLWGGGRTNKEWLRKFETGSNALKRGKLLASFFQHIDFVSRAGGSLFAPESLVRGNFLKAPSMVAQMFRAQWWPAARESLQKELLSGKPLYKNFKISLRDVVENGWEVTGDRSVIQRAFLDHIDEAVGAEGRNQVLNGLNDAKNFFERGLFEGVYTVAQTHALKNFIIPSLRRQHPDWTVQQIAGAAADQVNVMFSTLGDWQTIMRFAGDDLRSLTRSVIFSTNESESLIRGAIRALGVDVQKTRPGFGRSGLTSFRASRNPHFQQFAQWYVGMFIFMAGIANAIHFAATGKALPSGSYNPIDTDNGFTPFAPGYNTRFLSPEMPFVRGRNDLPVHMDIVGQMDTAFNWALDPLSAAGARTNVLPRAIHNQLGSGENFFGEPLQTPGQRVGQAALDLGAPIGVQAAVGAASEGVPALQNVFPAAESRLGVTGQIAQTSGVNFRSLRNSELRELVEERPEFAEGVAAELERRRGEDLLRFGNLRGQFTPVLQARLEDARRLNQPFVVRAIEQELQRRGELE